jgi:hypothetical protein
MSIDRRPTTDPRRQHRRDVVDGLAEPRSRQRWDDGLKRWVKLPKEGETS